VPALVHSARVSNSLSVKQSIALKVRISELLTSDRISERVVNLLVPELQQMLSIFVEESHGDLFIFLDDVHYLSMKEQPLFIDMLHGIIRDNATWIKAAGIKH
jgi:hypothetical protein